MKKILKSLLLITIILIISTGCNKKDPTTKDFKNPKTISFEEEKGKIELSYDDNGNYEEQDYVSGKAGKILKNKENNFRMAIEFYEQSSRELEKTKKLLEDSNNRIIFDVEFRNMKGFALISKTDGTTDIYLYANKKSDVIVNIRISSIEKRDLKNVKDMKEVLFNQEEVQQILKTIKYNQTKKK